MNRPLQKGLRRVLAVADSKVFALLIVGGFFFVLVAVRPTAAGSPPPIQHDVPVQVNLTVCGDSIISPPEICDDGMANGTYSVTIAGRFCNDIDCQGYAEYCGDLIIQPIFGEECDDGNNVSGDNCSADCMQENPLGGMGGGGGGSGPFNPGMNEAPVDTAVRIFGKAYPNVPVNVLKDGAVVGVVGADSSANYSFQTEDVTPGITTFSVWAEDVNGLQSISLSLTFRAAANAVTTVTGAYLPPTIGLEDNVIDQGELLPVFGQTVPEATVQVQKNQDETSLTPAGANEFGSYNIQIPTDDLTNEEFHTVGAYFETTDAGTGEFIQSGFGRFVSFFVGQGQGDEDNCARSDINNDTRVNLVDFSILLFNWNTSNANSDINFDGTVNLIDFSIQLFCWTG